MKTPQEGEHPLYAKLRTMLECATEDELRDALYSMAAARPEEAEAALVKVMVRR